MAHVSCTVCFWGVWCVPVVRYKKLEMQHSTAPAPLHVCNSTAIPYAQAPRSSQRGTPPIEFHLWHPRAPTGAKLHDWNSTIPWMDHGSMEQWTCDTTRSMEFHDSTDPYAYPYGTVEWNSISTDGLRSDISTKKRAQNSVCGVLVLHEQCLASWEWWARSLICRCMAEINLQTLWRFKQHFSSESLPKSMSDYMHITLQRDDETKQRN